MEARKFVMKNYLKGTPTVDDFELITEKLDPESMKDGEIMIKGICFSVDPYMRPFANQLSQGNTMPGSQVAVVLKSKNPKYPEGSKLVAYAGWRDASIINPDTMGPGRAYPLPDLQGLPDSYALGACGMPGMTAYFGFLNICEPKEGETVVVSTAAGAVGSLVTQIALLKGCKVVAFAGTDEKVKWIKDEFGVKFAFNYKEVHLDSILKKFAVEGVDCYFDNVGGEFTYTVTKNMNENGRIALCGAISQYNRTPDDNLVPFDYFSLIYKQVKMHGFMVYKWIEQFPQGMAQMVQWIKEGKIKVRETHTKGFENIPAAFLGLFEGKNIGKAIVTSE